MKTTVITVAAPQGGGKTTTVEIILNSLGFTKAVDPKKALNIGGIEFAHMVAYYNMAGIELLYKDSNNFALNFDGVGFGTSEMIKAMIKAIRESDIDASVTIIKTKLLK